VLVALVISGLAVAGIVRGYYVTVTSAERFALSLSADAQALKRIEQLRSARWDTSISPPVDQLIAASFTNQVVTLDQSGAGTNVTYATNFVQITTISTSPNLRRIHVDCVWAFQQNHLMTNSIESCRAPDQ
jgi:hypothetical protein